ncbi:hypothetical protein ACQX36_11690, partial [Corynebacterium diphtheriae]
QEKSLDFEPQPKSSINNYNQFKTTVLQPPIESKLHISGLHYAGMSSDEMSLEGHYKFPQMQKSASFLSCTYETGYSNLAFNRNRPDFVHQIM